MSHQHLWPFLGIALGLGQVAHAGKSDKVRELLKAKNNAAAVDLCKNAALKPDQDLREVCAVAEWPAANTADTAATWARYRKRWENTMREHPAYEREAVAAVRAIEDTATPADFDELAKTYVGTPAAKYATTRSVELILDGLGDRSPEAAYRSLIGKASNTPVEPRVVRLAAEAAVRDATSAEHANKAVTTYPEHPALTGLLPGFLEVLVKPVPDGMGFRLEPLAGVLIPDESNVRVDYGYADGDGVITWRDLLTQMRLPGEMANTLPACPQLSGLPDAQLVVQGLVEPPGAQAAWPVDAPVECEAEPSGAVPAFMADGAVTIAGRGAFRQDGSYRISVPVPAASSGRGDYSAEIPAPSGPNAIKGQAVYTPIGALVMTSPLSGQALPWLATEPVPEGAVELHETMLLDHPQTRTTPLHPVVAGVAEVDPAKVDPLTGERISLPGFFAGGWAVEGTYLQKAGPGGAQDAQVIRRVTPPAELVQQVAPLAGLPGLASLSKAWAVQIDPDAGQEWLVVDRDGNHWLVDAPFEGSVRAYPLPPMDKGAVIQFAVQGRPHVAWLKAQVSGSDPAPASAYLLFQDETGFRAAYYESGI